MPFVAAACLALLVSVSYAKKPAPQKSPERMKAIMKSIRLRPTTAAR